MVIIILYYIVPLTIKKLPAVKDSHVWLPRRLEIFRCKCYDGYAPQRKNMYIYHTIPYRRTFLYMDHHHQKIF